MELEVLKTRFEETLGGTKLQLSERTIDGLLQDALAEIGDNDEMLTDDFINRKISFAKTIEGQINHDVSVRIKDFKDKFTPPKKQTEHQENDDTESEEMKLLRERLEKLESANEELKKKETIGGIRKKIAESLERKFEKAGVAKNAYVLKQTLRDIDITEETDIASTVKKAEEAYYANMKEANLDVDVVPHRGGSGGGQGKTSVDDYFAKKKARENWGK